MLLSEQQLLERIYVRSAQIRRHRRAWRGTLSALALVMMVVAVSLPSSRDDVREVDTVDAPGSTTAPTNTTTTVSAGSRPRTGIPGQRARQQPEPTRGSTGGTTVDSEGAPRATSARGRIAFIDLVPGADNSRLITVNADGSGARVLTTVAPNGYGINIVRWSPDGSRLAYLDGASSSLRLINADGSGATRITAAGLGVLDFDWAPNGREIVYLTARPKGAYPTYSPFPGISADGDITIVSTDGVTQRPITADMNSDWSPRWSHDGSEIHFLRYGADGDTNGLYAIGRDGLGLRMIRAGEFSTFSRSPDNTRFAVIGQASSGFVDVFAMDGSRSRRLLTQFDPGWLAVPRWSPDGADVAVFDVDKRLFRLATDGSRQEVISSEVVGGVDWLRDGRSLIVCTSSGVGLVSRDGAQRVAVMRANLCRALDLRP